MLRPILAYIDPGSGSLIIQVLIASLVSIPIVFRRQVGRLMGLLRRKNEPDVASDDTPDAAD